MFLIFILLWVIALILIVNNGRKEWSWWASATLFLNGFGGITVIFTDNILPYVETLNEPNLLFFCLAAKGLANVLQHYFATYTLIIFVLTFTDFLNTNISKRLKLYIKVLLFFPSLMMCFLYPITPAFDPNYKVLSIWVVIYTIAAAVILILSFYKQEDAVKKKSTLITIVFTIPSSVVLMWTSYLSVAVNIENAWYFNFWIIAFQFIIFLYLGIRYGILGIKVRIEKISYESSMDIFIDGTSYISNAVKRETSEIIKQLDELEDDLSISTEQKLKIIRQSADNLISITSKIGYKLDKIEIKQEPYVLSMLIQNSIDIVEPHIKDKNIKITNRSIIDATLTLDVNHMTEMLKNILINAIEAIDHSGEIIIETEIRGESLLISISDNGCGINSQDLMHVITPFFTTKKDASNLGLGLSYCFRVMKAHSGELIVKSKESVGSVVQMLFPMSEVLNVTRRIFVDI